MGYFNNSNNSLSKLTGTMPSLSSTPMPKLLGGMPDLNAGNISKVELAKGGEIGQYSNDRYGKQQEVSSGRSLIGDLQNSSIGELGQLMNMQANASKDATQTSVSAQKELMNAQKGGFAGVVTGGGERGGFGMGATNQPEKGSYWDAGSGVTKTITSTFGGGSYGGGDSSPKVGGASSISLGTKLAQGAADAGIQAMQNKNQLEYQRSLNEMESISKQKERDWQSQMERERDARQNANQKDQMRMQSEFENQRLRSQSQLENQRMNLQSQLEMQKIGAQSQANMQSSMMQGMFGMLGSVGGGSSSGYRYW